MINLENIDNLKKIKSYAATLQSIAGQFLDICEKANRLEKQESELNQLKRGNENLERQLGREKRTNHLLVNVLAVLVNVLAESHGLKICPECNGEGIVGNDEEGGDCPKCNGKGIIKI